MNHPPQSRHQALQPLSRHHHHALVAAQKLLRATDEEKDSIIHSTLEFWNSQGNRHFIEEESILLPTFARFSDIHRNEVIQMLLEHVEIRSLIQLIQQPSPKIEVMHRLGERLQQHVRFEERVVFPLLQATIPEHELVQLPDFTQS